MRVLLTADTVGGVWTYAVELARALPSCNVQLGEEPVEVVVATMGRPLSDAQRRQAEGLDVRDSAFALEWMDDPWEDVARAGEWLLELREEVEADVVHLGGYAHAALPWSVPVLVAAHSDVLTWHQAVRGRPAGQEWSRYAEEVQRGLAAADAIVAPTHAMLDALGRHYELPEERHVVSNGRRPLRPRPKEPLIACAGRLWDEGKNAAAVERVAPRLEWRVEFAAGDRTPDEVEALLARASILALPARYEPFGYTPVEAASAGAALVLGDVETLREIWGDAALFVLPDDDEALEGALRRLIRDEGLRGRLAERARERSRRYGPEAMARAYADLYAALARRKVRL